MQIKLSKPLMSADGKMRLSKEVTEGEGDSAVTFDVIEMDLDALTGMDVEICARDAFAAKGEPVLLLGYDHVVHVQVASRASGISVNDLRRLPAPKYVEVVTAVQGFLTGSV